MSVLEIDYDTSIRIFVQTTARGHAPSVGTSTQYLILLVKNLPLSTVPVVLLITAVGWRLCVKCSYYMLFFIKVCRQT